MSEEIPKRPWRVIAKELADEKDIERMLELCQELEQAFDEDTKPRSPRVPEVNPTENPDSNAG